MSTLVVLVVLGIPALVYALVNLTSGGGFVFDIEDTTNGDLLNGSVDAYDGCYYLSVNGTRYASGGVASTTSLGGRQVEMAEVTIGSLRARRLVYVPTSGGDYARFLDVVSNPGATDVAATIQINGNLGSDSGTVVTGSSTGDTSVTATDTWFSTDDGTDAGGDPSLAHVFQGGSGSLVTASTASISSDSPTWSFSVNVPAGGRVAILTFALQASNRATSQSEAARIVALPADVLVGLDDYLADIVNFPLGGAPIVRFTSPSDIDEGTDATIEIAVSDLEGDTPTWSWDLDGDGTFGELPGGTSYTIPADTTDGDSTLTVAVEATDGTNTRVARRSIIVHNLPPAITSTPPTAAFVRREYVYDVEVADPAGTNDPPGILLTTRPPGMEITPEGRITWTPLVDARARRFPVTVRVNDGDGGQAEQMWEIAVAANQPPEPPTPMSPIGRMRLTPGTPVTLIAENGTDPDGDTLTYFFQISGTSSFTGPGVFGSGELDEGADGTTAWTTAGPLEEGLWYWRVWVSDGIVESNKLNATFVVGANGHFGDGGVLNADASLIPGIDAGTTTPRGGCACRSAPGTSRGNIGSIVALLAVALATVRRRREKR